MAEQADNSLALTTLGIVAVFAAALFAIIVGFGIFAPAHGHERLAHSWYPQFCCGERDCRPVSCMTIRETKDGYIWNGIKFPTATPSQDNQCHVCTGGTIEHPFGRCLFMKFEPVT